MSSPKLKKEESGESSSDRTWDSKVLSSQKVGGFMYELVGFPEKTLSPKQPETSSQLNVLSSPMKHVARPKTQRARKSFPARPSKVPQNNLPTEIKNSEEASGDNSRPPAKAAFTNHNSTVEVLEVGELSQGLAHPAKTSSNVTTMPNTVAVSGFTTPKKGHAAPSAVGYEDSGNGSLLDAAEKRTVLNSMKKEYTSKQNNNTTLLNKGEIIYVTESSRKDRSSAERPFKTKPVVHSASVSITGELLEGETDASASKKYRIRSPILSSSPIGGSETISEMVAGPPTPSATPCKEDLDVEAAMAVLHGEPLDDFKSTPSTEVQEVSIISIESTSTSNRMSDEDYTPYKAVSTNSTSVKFTKGTKKSGEKSAPSGSSSANAKTQPRNRGISRELDRLYMDEGANKIFQEMAEKGASSRRTVVRESPAAIRSPRRSTPTTRAPGSSAKKRKMKQEGQKEVPAHDEVLKEPAMRQWEALQPNAGDDVVFVPRKYVDRADTSQIARRKSYSSDSSSDVISVPKKKSVPIDLSASLSSTSSKQTGDRDVSTTSHDRDHAVLAGEQLVQQGRSACNDAVPIDQQIPDYRELQVRCRGQLLQVTLSPCTSTLPNSLNSAILRELIVLFQRFKTDYPKINVVLFTSSGTDFCTGIDLPVLIKGDAEEKRQAACLMADLIQDFITELVNCEKVLVGGVHGAVIGLGVAILPYLDVVYVSDKSTFYLPYAKLGQGTEGGLPLSFQNSFTTRSLLSLLVYEGRRLTAAQALNMGLVDEVLWPSSFHEELIPRVQTLANQTCETSLLTKKLMRASLRRQLPAVLKEESQLLKQSWMSDEFQRRAALVLANGKLLE